MEIKDATVFTKVSTNVLFLIRQVARTQGLSISEYVRFLILNDLERRGAIDQKISADALEQVITA